MWRLFVLNCYSRMRFVSEESFTSIFKLVFARTTKVKYLAQGHSIRCKAATRNGLFPVHYPNQQSMLQPMIYDRSKAQSFVVSAAYKNALFSVWSRWKGAHNISERALVSGITFPILMRFIFQIHPLFSSKNTMGFHLVRRKKVDFLFWYRHVSNIGKKGDKPMLPWYFAISCFQEAAAAISSWVVSTNYLDFNLESSGMSK